MIVPWDVLLLGFAMILDAVLLLILLERVNASQVGIWLKFLVAATWLSHSAGFVRSLSFSDGESELQLFDRVCFSITGIGLLVLPSAMLHAAVRLVHTGSEARPKSDFRYGLLYIPLLVLPWVFLEVWNGHGHDFLTFFSPLVVPYLVWLVVANSLSICLFLLARARFEAPEVRSFFVWHSVLMAAITLLACFYTMYGAHWRVEPWLRLITILSPLAPLLLFVWYTLRMRLLPLVMERTLLYGAVILGLILSFRFTIAPFVQRWNARSELDLFSLELAALVLLILLWRPLRIRVLESIRYLVSNNVFQVRDATRRLSVQLSKFGSLPPDALIQNFQSAVAQAIALRHCSIRLFSPQPQPSCNFDGSAAIEEVDSPSVSAAIATLQRAMDSDDDGILSREWGVNADVANAMEQLDVIWAFRLNSGIVQGLVMLGPRWRCDRLADEQRTALSMLFEQLAVTLENRFLDAQRLRAERFAMQQDKLSTLGLMASTWAHEIRNPLSSIKTLTSLAMEDSRAGNQSAADLQMILSEIDRMSATTQRLLEFARPNQPSLDSSRIECSIPDKTLERLLFVLKQFALQSHVNLNAELRAPETLVRGSDSELGEIFFNLIKNAIEALVSTNCGSVVVRSFNRDGWLHVEVSDDGPGIDPQLQQTLFQPFVTGKPTGNGLGLFVAFERAKELGGQLVCDSEPGQGTIFRVSLPIQTSYTDPGALTQ